MTACVFLSLSTVVHVAAQVRFISKGKKPCGIRVLLSIRLNFCVSIVVFRCDTSDSDSKGLMEEEVVSPVSSQRSRFYHCGGFMSKTSSVSIQKQMWRDDKLLLVGF